MAGNLRRVETPDRARDALWTRELESAPATKDTRLVAEKDSISVGISQ